MHYVGLRFGWIVELAHQLVVRAGVAVTDVAIAASVVGQNHAVNLLIGDEEDRAIDVLEHCAPRKLRRANLIYRIELILVERVCSKFLEHIGV